MFNFNYISKNIARKIACENSSIDKDKEEVIAYGIYGILQIGASILLVILFGIIFNVFIEALIMSFGISILRKYSGGVHSNSSSGCLIIGTLICVLIPLLINRIHININSTIAMSFIIFIFSYIIIYRLSPVDSPNKPIRKIERRKKLKKRSMQVLTIYLLILIAFIIFYYLEDNYNLLLYANVLGCATLWQVFSLTKLGHKLLGALDTFFIKQFHL